MYVCMYDAASDLNWLGTAMNRRDPHPGGQTNILARLQRMVVVMVVLVWWEGDARRLVHIEPGGTHNGQGPRCKCSRVLVLSVGRSKR